MGQASTTNCGMSVVHSPPPFLQGPEESWPKPPKQREESTIQLRASLVGHHTTIEPLALLGVRLLAGNHAAYEVVPVSRTSKWWSGSSDCRPQIAAQSVAEGHHHRTAAQLRRLRTIRHRTYCGGKVLRAAGGQTRAA